MIDQETFANKYATIGDTIECVEPTQTDTPMFPAGTHLRATLETREAVAHANTLIASGRWRKVEKQGPNK